MEDSDINEILDVYYEPGMQSINKVYTRLADKFTKSEIKNAIKNQNTFQLNKRITRQDLEDRFLKVVGKPNHYQMDLFFMKPKYKKFNEGKIIFLTIISLATRYGYLYPIKTKKADQIKYALNQFIEDQKERPEFDRCKYVMADSGSEFFSKSVIEYLNNNGIELFYTNKSASNTNALSVCERFNRTCREMITSYLISSGGNKYIDAIPEMIDNYNNNIHRTMGKKPIDVTENDVIERNETEEEHNKTIYNMMNQFNVDDPVRIIKKKGLFDKGKNFVLSDKIYLISRVSGNRVYLKNEQGKENIIPRYFHEIQKADDVEFRKEKNIYNKKEIKSEDKKIKHMRKLKREGLDITEKEVEEILNHN